MSGNGTRTVSTGGVRLAYRAWGAEEGRPVVLLHCLGEDGEDWRGPLVSQLGGAHPVYALDLRGHGESEQPGSGTPEDFSGDLLGFLDALGIERAVLIGHAFGAVVAYLFAQEHPGRVDLLVLEEPDALRPPVEPPLPEPEPAAAAPAFDPRAQPEWTGRRSAPEPRWWDRLAAITAPTLVIGGGDDSHLPQAELGALAERIPAGRHLTVEGAGHLVHESRPGEFTSVVRQFLAEHTPAPVHEAG